MSCIFYIQRPVTTRRESAQEGIGTKAGIVSTIVIGAVCTGCELCGEFCLKGAIRIHPKGEAADGGG